MPQIFVNNCYGTLSQAVNTTSTTFEIGSAEGLPELAEGDWFLVTLFTDDSRYGSDLEVVKVTAIAANQMTIERGVEGNAYSHPAGSKFEARLTAGTVNTIAELAAKPSWELGDIRRTFVDPGEGWVKADGSVVPTTAASKSLLLVDFGEEVTVEGDLFGENMHNNVALSPIGFDGALFIGDNTSLGSRAFTPSGESLFSHVVADSLLPGKYDDHARPMADGSVMVTYTTGEMAVFSLDGTVSVVPRPHETVDVHRATVAGDLFAAGLDNGMFYTSADSGATWVEASVDGATSNFRLESYTRDDGYKFGDVYFLFASRLYDGGYGDHLISSTDGVNWTRVPIPSMGSSLQGMFVLDGTIYVFSSYHMCAVDATSAGEKIDHPLVGTSPRIIGHLDGRPIFAPIGRGEGDLYSISPALEAIQLGGFGKQVDLVWISDDKIYGLGADSAQELLATTQRPRYALDAPTRFPSTLNEEGVSLKNAAFANAFVRPDGALHVVEGAFERIIRSSDGGITWEVLNNRSDLGSNAESRVIAKSAYHPGTDTLVVAQDGVSGVDTVFSKSQDGGITFTDIIPGELKPFAPLRVAFAGDSLVYSATDGRVVSSADLATTTDFPTVLSASGATLYAYELRSSDSGNLAAAFGSGKLAISTTLTTWDVGEFQLDTTSSVRVLVWVGDVLLVRQYISSYGESRLFTFTLDGTMTDVTEDILPWGSKLSGLVEFGDYAGYVEVLDLEGSLLYYRLSESGSWEFVPAPAYGESVISSDSTPHVKYDLASAEYIVTESPYYIPEYFLALPSEADLGDMNYIYLGE